MVILSCLSFLREILFESLCNFYSLFFLSHHQHANIEESILCIIFRFFFDLIVKSMVEHLAATQILDSPRKLRFSEQFTDDLSTLITTMTSDIIASYNKDPKVDVIDYRNIILICKSNSLIISTL